MELIIFKTIFLYFFVVLVYRIMGKKEVGQLGIIDLIVSILIAELVAFSLESQNESLLRSIVPITTLLVIQVVLSYITIKSDTIRTLLEGKPTILIKQGKLLYKQLKKMRYSLDDLVSQLREKGVRNLDEVDYAILENNGKLSVFKDKGDYPLPLILDGKIDCDALKYINKNEEWMYTVIGKRNILLEEIFYCFIKKNKTYIITRTELNKKRDF